MNNIKIEDFVKLSGDHIENQLFGEVNNGTDYRIIIDVHGFNNYLGKHDKALQDEIKRELESFFTKSLKEDYPEDAFNTIMKEILLYQNELDCDEIFSVQKQSNFIGQDGRHYSINTINTGIYFKPKDNLMKLANELYEFIMKHVAEQNAAVFYFLDVKFRHRLLENEFTNNTQLILRCATQKK